GSYLASVLMGVTDFLLMIDLPLRQYGVGPSQRSHWCVRIKAQASIRVRGWNPTNQPRQRLRQLVGAAALVGVGGAHGIAARKRLPAMHDHAGGPLVVLLLKAAHL